MKALYELDEESQRLTIEISLTEKNSARLTEVREGMGGTAYFTVSGDYTPPLRLVAKCPLLKNVSSREEARSKIAGFISEVEKTNSIRTNPWINRFYDITYIRSWPFAWSSCHSGTLKDLINTPNLLSVPDRLSILIMICRALRLARAKGILTHQDLKPENIFFDRLIDKFREFDNNGVNYWIYVGDFGRADAILDRGSNTGPPPYMAPEQFRMTPLSASDAPYVDVFALGVILFEMFTDGNHPIGVKTADVWPRRDGISRKWGEARTWRNWANKDPKPLTFTVPALTDGLTDLVAKMLSSSPKKRPSLEEVEERLWSILNPVDHHFFTHLRRIVDWRESKIAAEDSWPHMDECFTKLLKFYSKL